MASNGNMGGKSPTTPKVFGQGGNMTEEQRRQSQMEDEQDSFGNSLGQNGQMGEEGQGAGTSGGGRDASRSEGGNTGGTGGMGGSGQGGY